MRIRSGAISFLKSCLCSGKLVSTRPHRFLISGGYLYIYIYFILDSIPTPELVVRGQDLECRGVRSGLLTLGYCIRDFGTRNRSQSWSHAVKTWKQFAWLPRCPGWCSKRRSKGHSCTVHAKLAASEASSDNLFDSVEPPAQQAVRQWEES